jgi:hypothetical protein
MKERRFSMSREAAKRLYSSAGGHVTIARHGAAAVASRAREGLWQKLLQQVDPEGVLPEAERVKRAEHLRTAHMKLIAFNREKSRAAKKAALRP